jgi:hypothetical protein
VYHQQSDAVRQYHHGLRLESWRNAVLRLALVNTLLCIFLERYSGTCDKDGCDFNSYRMGNTSFLGPSKIVDTTKPFTIVTQFVGSGSTLTEIRRFYVQNGKLIPNSQSTISGVSGNSVCSLCAS